MASYMAIEDLRKAVDIPKDNTVSRVIHQDARAKFVVLGLAGGQEISSHTVALATAVQVLEGQVRFSLDGEENELATGAWVFLEANVQHAVYARSDAILLLTLLQ